MKIYRIHISSWTASFRYPNIMSGFQPTLAVPPLSTINGLISAALGSYYAPDKQEMGYVFQTKGKSIDLETIYQMKRSLKGITSNVIKREFLADNDLWLYTGSEQIVRAFEKPFFPLLLGRSGDLASVNEITELDVEFINELSILKGTILPFGEVFVPAPIQALPVYFSNTIPRRNIGTKPYFLLDAEYRLTQPVSAKGFHDENKKWDVYWQE